MEDHLRIEKLAARLLDELDKRDPIGCHEEREALREALDDPRIFTNYRGKYPTIDGPVDIDGADGWPWVAWRGGALAHGADEDQATTRLLERLEELG